MPRASESTKESLDMCIVGITVKISDYVVDNVPLGRSEGVSGSVQEHLVVLLKCASEWLHRHQRVGCLAGKVPYV